MSFSGAGFLTWAELSYTSVVSSLIAQSVERRTVNPDYLDLSATYASSPGACCFTSPASDLDLRLRYRSKQERAGVLFASIREASHEYVAYIHLIAPRLFRPCFLIKLLVESKVFM